MDMIQTLNELSSSQQQLNELNTYLSGQPDLKEQEEASAFLYDLRDYSDALSVVTDLVDAQTFTKQHDPAQISNMLVDQAKLITSLRESFEAGESPEGLFMSEGECRRTAASLVGVKELNMLILQDNLRFQKIVAGVTLGAAVPYKEKKVGFFKRLFGQN
jgi:hypothetical protein